MSDLPLQKNQIGFGGGCHWCTEAVFQALGGVIHVDQGFVKARPPYDSFSEAVLVEFDPEIIPQDVLLEIHLRTHASTSDHKMRGKYRSAVYVFGDEQREEIRTRLDKLQAQFDEPLVTQVLDMAAFKPSTEQFQNYYADGPKNRSAGSILIQSCHCYGSDMGRIWGEARQYSYKFSTLPPHKGEVDYRRTTITPRISQIPEWRR